MIRSANVRRLLLFLVTEDRQAAIRWRFSHPLDARAAEKVQSRAVRGTDGGRHVSVGACTVATAGVSTDLTLFVSRDGQHIGKTNENANVVSPPVRPRVRGN